MLHSTIAQVADAEATVEDFNRSDLKCKLEKLLSDIPEVEDPIPFTLQMITVLQKDEDTYYVDFDSLMRYIHYSDLDVITVFNQLADEYDIDKDKLYLVLPCKDKLMYTFDEYKCCPSHVGEKLLKKVGNIVSLIENLQAAGINIVIWD